MRKLIFFLAVILFSYEGQVLPFEEYDIKADVSGKVIKTFKNLENSNLKNRLIIRLDDSDERIDLKNIENQIEILKAEINNQKEVVKRKRELYLRYENLKTKSFESKSLKFYDYINAKNQLLNLKSNLSNLIAKRDKLKDLIKKKNIRYSGYLSEILVSTQDYVTPGRLIAKGYDLSKEKIYIYIPIDKVEKIKSKQVYINGKKSNFKISKIWKVNDSKYVTSYKVELVGKGLKIGDIVKIDFKKE